MVNIVELLKRLRKGPRGAKAALECILAGGNVLKQQLARAAPAVVAFFVETVANMEHDALGGATDFGMLSGGVNSSARLSVANKDEKLGCILRRELAFAFEARAAGEGEGRVQFIGIFLL